MKNLKFYITISFLLISARGNSVFTSNFYLSEEINLSTDSLPQNSGANIENSLPLVITPANPEVKYAPAAFIISGDGGWYKFEQAIADELAELGIPTIGLDTKKYFWNRRTPEETASDINACLEHFGREWRKEDFIIIGYSLGAELLPFVINRFPDSTKSRISIFVLLSPSATTDFQVHFTDMLGIGNRKNNYSVIDEIKKIHATPSLLIFGANEKSKVPALLKGTSVMIDIIPGDHHYNNNTSLIVQTMKNHQAF